jgi:hypothetical protein
MANWSKANVIYCDGGSFSGNADAPVVAAGSGMPAAEVNRTLYFRGQRNLDAVIDELKSRGMDKANTAVLGGCSAGGLGALVQCDHFSSKLPGANRTRCIGDAGTFLNAESLTKFEGGKKSVMAMQFGNLVSFQNASLSAACLASANNTFPAACFFPQNTLPTQKTPTFVRNSFYNYGEWETLPWNWHNSHNFTPGGGGETLTRRRHQERARGKALGVVATQPNVLSSDTSKNSFQRQWRLQWMRVRSMVLS